jgi:DNA-binding response OmpR family regulator
LTSGNTILLVDDSPRILPLVRAILNELDCRIIEASTGDQALALAASQSSAIDLLLTDIAMPGISGIELAAQMRRHHPTLRVLFMSGYTLPSKSSNGVHYIEKPFRPDALLSKVRAVLKGT